MQISIGRSRGNTVALFDIAPGEARAAILAGDGASSRVTVQAHSALTLEDRSPAQAKQAIVGEIAQAAQSLVEPYAKLPSHPAITKAYVVVHAPWSHSIIASARTSFEVPTTIRDSHIRDLAGQALSGESLAGIDKSALIESSVIRVSLNGYATGSPIGRRARALQVDAIASTCEASFRSSVEEAILKSFPGAALVWRSGMRALTSAVNASRPESRDYLAIEVGVDSSTLISVRGGIPVDEESVPAGMRSLLSAAGAGHSPEETLGLMRMLSREACESDACEALRQSLAKAEPDLVHAFGDALGSIAAKRKIANELLLFAHPDLSAWLTGFFSRIDFSQFTRTTLPFSVAALSPLDFPKVRNVGDQPGLFVAASLVNNEMEAR